MNSSPPLNTLNNSHFRHGGAAFGALLALASTACGGGPATGEDDTSRDIDPLSFSLDKTLPPQSIVDDDGKQCPRAKFKTIQAALDVAKDGDTILVCAGEYQETPVVSRTVTLLGAQHGVDGRTRKPDPTTETLVVTGGFDLVADGVVFDGFSLQARFSGSEDIAYGLFLHQEHSGYRVLNNLMGGPAGALFLGSSGAMQTEIRHNRFTGRGVFAGDDEPNVHAHNERIEENWFDGASLSFQGSGHSDLLILNNKLTDGATLSFFDNVFPTGTLDTRAVTVQGNTIEESGTNPAISLRHVQGAQFLSNTLEGGRASGFAVVGSNSRVYLEANIISGFDGSGIQLGELPPSGLTQELTTGLTVNGNQLRQNAIGIALLSAKGDSVSRNTIQRSKLVGIDVDANSFDNTLEANNVRSSKLRDCQDSSVGGGTGQTHDSWTLDLGTNSSPLGLCAPHQ